jgi:hypothetical protein
LIADGASIDAAETGNNEVGPKEEPQAFRLVPANEVADCVHAITAS